MLAICSDLDETPDFGTYWETVRFLNTKQETAMGPGVGLEVGNTIYFDMPRDQFSYWNTDDAGRAMVRALIRSGHIDCLHSFGELPTSRDSAQRALDELARHDCRMEVWVDHGRVPTNFGADIMYGHGDEPGHVAYHSDLTVAHGVKYVWRGRVTSVLGQNTRLRLRGIARGDHPCKSSQTLLKEAAKQILARCGSRKYAMHAGNDVLRPVRLRDGRPVYEFIRCNPHWGGVSCGETASGIAAVLTQDFIDRLASRRGVCVLYTHLGKVRDPRKPFDPAAVAALGRLAEAHQQGRIMVTTTRRLLGFCRARAEVIVSASSDTRGRCISVDTISGVPRGWPPLAESDLDGLTFYDDGSQDVRVTVNGQAMAYILRNPPDETGRRSVSIPWARLEFPTI
jgi:hypothetical protein